LRRWLAALAAAALAAGCGPPTSGQSAEELWREHCRNCHGDDGRGDRARRALAPRLDLTRSPLVRGGQRGPIYQRISYGYATMPGFVHKLERGDLELLTDYTLGLGGP